MTVRASSQPAPPLLREIRAEAGWQAVDFISDLHLHPADPATARAWRTYLAGLSQASPGAADALFILGDLFEAWPGDDCLRSPGFASDCASALRAVSAQRPVYFLHGNRDFLIGAEFAAATGVQLMDDPAVLDFGGRRVLLSHGDALCLADTDYQRFRAQVRHPAWIEGVLARPLAERVALAQQMREQSAASQRQMHPADADTALTQRWLQEAQAGALVHGHTHRPAEHDAGPGLRRWVLSDWDARATPPRAEALRLTRAGAFRRVPLAALTPDSAPPRSDAQSDSLK